MALDTAPLNLGALLGSVTVVLFKVTDPLPKFMLPGFINPVTYRYVYREAYMQRRRAMKRDYYRMFIATDKVDCPTNGNGSLGNT